MASPMPNNVTIVEFPVNGDILCGRGKPLQNHPGNVLLRELAESKLSEYIGAPYGLKSDMHEHVVRLVKKKTGARFLKQESVGGWWVQAPEDVAFEKVAHAFRTVMARQSKNTVATRGEQTIEEDGSQHPKRARVQEASATDLLPVLLP
jgi:hypothetical protein